MSYFTGASSAAYTNINLPNYSSASSLAGTFSGNAQNGYMSPSSYTAGAKVPKGGGGGAGLGAVTGNIDGLITGGTALAGDILDKNSVVEGFNEMEGIDAFSTQNGKPLLHTSGITEQIDSIDPSEASKGSILKGVGAGAKIGASAGAIAGSFIPVIGNVIGGLVGAVGGAIGGFFGGKRRKHEIERSAQDARVRLAEEKKDDMQDFNRALQGYNMLSGAERITAARRSSRQDNAYGIPNAGAKGWQI